MTIALLSLFGFQGNDDRFICIHVYFITVFLLFFIEQLSRIVLHHLTLKNQRFTNKGNLTHDNTNNITKKVSITFNSLGIFNDKKYYLKHLECDTDQETDRLLGAQRNDDRGFFDEKVCIYTFLYTHTYFSVICKFH